MILCAALRIKGTQTVIGCCRHGDGYSALHDLKPEIGMAQVEEGFLTDKGDFIDRTAALDHAWTIGQLSSTTYMTKHQSRETELYSEDLW